MIINYSALITINNNKLTNNIMMDYEVSFKTKTNLSNYFSKKIAIVKSYQNSKGNITINIKDRKAFPSHSIIQGQSKGNTTKNSPDRLNKKGNKKRDQSESYDTKDSLKKGISSQAQTKDKPKDKVKFDQLFMHKIQKMHTKNTQSYHQLTHSNTLLHQTNYDILQQQKKPLCKQKTQQSSKQKNLLCYKRCNSTFEDEQAESSNKYILSKSNIKKNSPRLFSPNGKKNKANVSINKENYIQSINIKDFQYLKTKHNIKKKTNNKTNSNNNSHSTSNNNISNQHPYVKYSSVLSQNNSILKIQPSPGGFVLECPHTKSIKNISLDFLSKSISQTKPNSRIQSKEKNQDKAKPTPLIQSIDLNANNNYRLSKKVKNSLASTKCSSSSLIKQNDNNRFNSSSSNYNEHQLNGFGEFPTIKRTFNNVKINVNHTSGNHHYNASQFAATSKHFLNMNDIQIIETITNANAQSRSSFKHISSLLKQSKGNGKQKGKDINSKDKLINDKIFKIESKGGQGQGQGQSQAQNERTKVNAKSNTSIKGLTLNPNYQTPCNKVKDPSSIYQKKFAYDLNSIINNGHLNTSSNKVKSPGLISTKYASPTENNSPLSKSNPVLDYLFDKKNEQRQEEQGQELQVNQEINERDNADHHLEDNKDDAALNRNSNKDDETVTERLSMNQPFNDTKTNQSIQSTIRESSHYQLEMESIVTYIQEYKCSKGNYPQSNINFYKYGRLIGKGAFGKVNLALHILSGRLIAIKSFNKSKIKNSREKAKIKHEIHALRKLQHPFISKILDTFETEKHILICMEYICGDLLSFVRKRSKLSENASKVIFKQIMEGLEFIHSNKIVHRDIKLDNILIDLNNTVKICDFGVSRKLNPGDIMHEHCGTLAYIAPEIFKEEGYEGYTCDIWSAGVTLYYMLSGVQPFKVSHNETFKEKVMKGEYEPLNTVSSEARDLINGMLQVDPLKRLTLAQILAHPWLAGFNLKYKTNINLFTNAEKIILKKYDVNYLKSSKKEMVENFSMRNLDTVIDEEKKYGNTRSLILAPYNSYASSISSLSSLEDIKIENALCRYKDKANQANLKYELNNNADFDNGVIITQNDSSENNKDQDKGQDKDNNKEKNIISNKDSASKAFSPCNELRDEINIISGLNSPNNKKRNEIKYDMTEPLTIRENIIREIEANMGYDYSYLVNCLKLNEVNYATATYHLLLKDFNDNLG